jgi:glycogen phosphorylase
MTSVLPLAFRWLDSPEPFPRPPTTVGSVRAIRSFTVRPRLPEALLGLERLAMNLRWSWDERTRDLFRWVDPALWDATAHDPVALLGRVPRERFDQLANDKGFGRFLTDAVGDLDRYITEDRWFQGHQVDGAPSPLRRVAYFSPEFGISEALPQYSGGLGVLAGDHLKAASDLAVPIVGIGLFYRHGYFRQSLDLAGWQQERFPDLDPYAMAVHETAATIELPLADTTLHARIWRADVGRTPLYMLDADIDVNAPELRIVTDRLYGGDVEHRLRQEILLGMGGVLALHALGIDAQVFHSNEGHAGFLGLQRIRELVTTQGLTFDEALEVVRAGGVFTTHTPVPAGIDRFPRELMEKYFSKLAADCGIPFDRLYALGQRADEDDARFNMAVMGLRLAARSNAVAALHGAVSRDMFGGLWPDVPADEAPITSVTNGVHAPTWVCAEISDLLARTVLPEWDMATDADWQRVNEIRDDELWRAKEQGRERMVLFIRERLGAAMRQRGLSSSDATWTDEVLDPRVLTIGFARRFATYKRANLLLSQPERLKALLLSADRPVQFVFAGKAHPADQPGKQLIQQIAQFASEAGVRHRFVFLDDYDIAVARAFYAGCDVWLNNPRRPLEACGTSGMKAALNGALNCSILDGWWDECFDGTNGWAITSAEQETDLAKRDLIEANSLFDILEHQIVPLFYEVEGRLPRRWLARVKHNFRTLGPFLPASRMVREYVERLYEPAASAANLAVDGRFAQAKALSAWKSKVADGWSAVTIGTVAADDGAVALGAARTVTADVHLGPLSTDDVEVQLVAGPVGAGDELVAPAITAMTVGADGRWTASFGCERAGRYGYTVRVVPSHPLLATPVELGRIVFAD